MMCTETRVTAKTSNFVALWREVFWFYFVENPMFTSLYLAFVGGFILLANYPPDFMKNDDNLFSGCYNLQGTTIVAKMLLLTVFFDYLLHKIQLFGIERY